MKIKIIDRLYKLLDCSKQLICSVKAWENSDKKKKLEEIKLLEKIINHTGSSIFELQEINFIVRERIDNLTRVNEK